MENQERDAVSSNGWVVALRLSSQLLGSLIKNGVGLLERLLFVFVAKLPLNL